MEEEKNVMSVIEIVEQTARQNVPPGEQMNGLLGNCYQGIYRVHRLWRWYRRAEIYTNPDNILCLAVGHGLDWLGGGNSVVINLAAHILLVATRIHACVEEQVQVTRAARALCSERTSCHLLLRKLKWKRSLKKHHWLSLSSKISWKQTFLWLVVRIKRLAGKLLSLGQRLFLLSMKTLDAAEAFSYNNNRQERIHELFINSKKCLEVLISEKELLLHGLKKYRGIIAQILENTHSMFSADQFIEVVSNSFKVAESVHSGVECASKVVGDLGKDLAKRTAFGIFQAAGLLDLMPNSWVPPLHPSFAQESTALPDGPRYMLIREACYKRS